MIKGFKGTSLIDYPGKISSVIFTYGCNFRCPYCYNVDLILPERYTQLENIHEEDIIKELLRRKKFIKGVVITGGEPTIWGIKLIHFIERIVFETGLSVKLDTNGSNPELLEYFLKNKLLDYIAIDFKTSPSNYYKVRGDFEEIKKSLELLKNFAEKTEIRITLYPPLIGKKELEEMIFYLKGFKYIALQNFVPEETLSQEEVIPYSPEVCNSFAEYIKEKLPEVNIIKRF
jgi:pyruvate formate lyase activating enzyme